KIVYEGTRVLARPPDLMSDSARSGSFTRMSATVDRFSPRWLPHRLRLPTVVGVSTLVVAGAIVMGTLALMPSPVETRLLAEAQTRSVQAVAAKTKEAAPEPAAPAAPQPAVRPAGAAAPTPVPAG